MPEQPDLHSGGSAVRGEEYMGDHDHGAHREGPCPGCEREVRERAERAGESTARDGFGPTPCERHMVSSNLQEMARCPVCGFRGQYIAEAASILTGHPGLQAWEPAVLAEAMLVAVGLIERAP